MHINAGAKLFGKVNMVVGDVIHEVDKTDEILGMKITISISSSTYNNYEI